MPPSYPSDDPRRRRCAKSYKYRDAISTAELRGAQFLAPFDVSLVSFETNIIKLGCLYETTFMG